MTNAAWYYDKPSDTANTSDALSVPALTRSLRTTLNAYPQWVGQLQWIAHDSGDGKPERRGRASVTYGSANDPGIELIVAHSPVTLASLVPESKARLESGAWCADQFPSTQLLHPTELALYNPADYIGKPSACVQLTTFACGGVGIALRIAHALADATTLIQFAKNWASVHRSLINNQLPPALPVVFDPRLVDRAVTGDIDGVAPNPDIIRISRSLPIIKHDWSSLAPTHSLAADDAEHNPPVAHFLVYLHPTEVQRIWEDASANIPATSRISRFDALLAFIWRLIIRARSMKDDSSPVHMIVTVGVRTRLSPPLPSGFAGSPIVLARVSLAANEIAASTYPGAVAIRSTVSKFTAETLGAFMHDLAHQVDPQRYWHAFLRRRNAAYTCWRSLDVYALDFGTGARPPYIDAVMPSMDGRQHSVVTSWQDLDVYGVDFGVGAPPRYVDAFIPDMDGCIHIMEAGPLVGKASGGAGRWYDETVCLSLHLAQDVMQRLLQDPELRKYRSLHDED